MSIATLPVPMTATDATVTTPTAGRVDNRATYVSFGLAYVLGHGTAASSKGADPVLALPGWLPTTLLSAGIAVGTVCAIVAAKRAQRGATKPVLFSENLLGASWAIAFAALFLAITGLTYTLDVPDLQSMLWPTGSGLVVGLLYLGEGAVRRNVLHYSLGAWLALTSTTALFLSTPGLYWVLAIAGGGAYMTAAILERRRLATKSGRV